MNSILFLYLEILDIPIEETIAPVKSKKPRHLPVVVAQDEVKIGLVKFQGIHLVMAK